MDRSKYYALLLLVLSLLLVLDGWILIRHGVLRDVRRVDLLQFNVLAVVLLIVGLSEELPLLDLGLPPGLGLLSALRRPLGDASRAAACERLAAALAERDMAACALFGDGDGPSLACRLREESRGWEVDLEVRAARAATG